MRRTVRSGALATALVLFASGAALAGSKSAADFSVDFTDCVESIGVGLAPTASVEALLPPTFVPVGAGQPVTPLVVRTADCAGIAVDGAEPKSGSIVQIGVVIVPPDFTGDINNYTLLYYTSDAKLAHALNKVGVDAQHVPTIAYEYSESDGTLQIRVPVPGSPTLAIGGDVAPSSTSAGSFLANWWQADAATVKMATDVPDIAIGGADLTLRTRATNPLGLLIGGDTLVFPLVLQFNTFATARMDVTVD